MEQFTWAQLAGVVGLLGLIFTAWRFRQTDLAAISEKITNNTAALHTRIDVLTADLAAYKLVVASQHPTEKELNDSETRLTSAINRLTDRIDRWLEKQDRHGGAPGH